MTTCAGAFLFRDGQVLLGLRSQHEVAYPGLWDVVGGHVETGESPVDALIRELAEEVQIVPIDFFELAKLREPSCSSEEAGVYHIYLVTAWEGGGPVGAGDEHSELRWFSIPEALELRLAHPEYRRLLTELGSRDHV